MENQTLDSFFIDIKGTFFEQILNAPILETEREVCDKDVILGEASIFEKKCFSFYLQGKSPEKIEHLTSPEHQIKFNMRCNTALGFVRSIIVDRLNIDNREINKIWIRKGGIIVIYNMEECP